MADGATGTPTSLGIPKMNTGSDAPTGRGHNSSMDAIDSLLIARLVADAVTVAGTRVIANKLLVGDTQPVWRVLGSGEIQWGLGGTTAIDTNLYRVSANVLKTDDTFDAAAIRVAGVAIAASNLSNGTTGTGSVVLAAGPTLTGVPIAPTAAVDTNTTQLATTAFVIGQAYAKLASPALTGTPTAPTASLGTNTTQLATTAFVLANQAAPTLVTALPGSPTNGQEIIFTDSTSAPTYYWHLRYNSTTTKWHYIGGASLFSEIVTNENTSSATYAALATAGPSVVLPVAGDYDIEIGFTTEAGSGSGIQRMSYDIGGTGAVDADSIIDNAASGAVTSSVEGSRRKTGLTAVTLTAKYKSEASNQRNFSHRYMRVTPVKLG